jgi:ATP-dependent helicase HrpB
VTALDPLPIDPLLPDVVRAVEQAGALVLVAPPGAGKTTRVPRALLDAGLAAGGELVVLEPRRLAARMAARRVAAELGEAVGGVVGYTMRFEDASSAATRVRFVTEGTLTRRLLGANAASRELAGVSVVILDEVHERGLDGDLALALVERLRRGPRPDLRVVAMSATLHAEPFARFLDAPILRAEGRRFDVAIEHAALRDERPLEARVTAAVKQIVADQRDGDVLVFLPGALEIRRAGAALATYARDHDLLVAELHGSLSPADQDRAVRRAERRKVVLATNVAETSVTIDGVVAVVDSGLARVASHSPWSGLPTLELQKIAQASAEQRAGRAGRTRPGVCVRLYTKGDFDARPPHEAPDAQRADLADAALGLLAVGIDPARFAWFEAPPAAAIDAAMALLVRLGAARRGDARVTDVGRRMATLPLHPRLARLVVEAERRGVAARGAAIAALLGERDLGGAPRRADARHGSDVLALLERYEEAESARFDAQDLRRMGVDVGRALAVSRVVKQLARRLDARADAPFDRDAEERALGLAVLAAFPDRVGRLKRTSAAATRTRAEREVVFAGGGAAALSPASAVDDTDLVIAVDVEERREATRSDGPMVRLAHATDLDALIEIAADELVDEDTLLWSRDKHRVERVRRLQLGALVLEEQRAVAPPSSDAARVLADAVRAAGWRKFTNDDALDAFLARVAFARAHAPELGLPDVDEPAIEAALAELCDGATSFEDLRARDLASRIRGRLTHEQARDLDVVAPTSITLARGRKVTLEYLKDQPPRAASRLQDFFDMKEGPRVARGRVAVLLELLAPNQRAVQVTSDLAGFWSKHYPSIAKELRRKYPRHAWPDDPLHAPPEPPRRGAR